MADENGPLTRAVDENRPDVLRQLLEEGADPDERFMVTEDDGSLTPSWGQPLYQCARYGKPRMAEMLLEHGADPNGQVYASGTPLSEAYGQRDEAMIALLVRYGGKPNASMAGLYRRKDLALRLLEEHGDAVLPDDGFSKGTVAEQLVGGAAQGGDPEVMRLGMERVTWSEGDRRWFGPLFSCAGFWNHWIGPWCHLEWDRTGYLTCFRMLLERTGPPVLQGRNGWTILHRIADMGDHVWPAERVAFATAALDAGARLDLQDDAGMTALDLARKKGRGELVELFLARGGEAR